MIQQPAARVGAPSALPWHRETYAYAHQPSTMHTDNEATDDDKFDRSMHAVRHRVEYGRGA